MLYESIQNELANASRTALGAEKKTPPTFASRRLEKSDSWSILLQSNAQRVIRLRVPLHLDDLGAIYGWRPVFRNFLENTTSQQRTMSMNMLLVWHQCEHDT